MRSAQLVNRKQFYVSISRARQDARVYSDDAQALRRAVGRDQRKEVALENGSDAADSATAAEVADSGGATATNDRHQHSPLGK